MYVPAGWLYSIVLPGIGLARGVQAWVASTAVSTTLPGFDLVFARDIEDDLQSLFDLFELGRVDIDSVLVVA